MGKIRKPWLSSLIISAMFLALVNAKTLCGYRRLQATYTVALGVSHRPAWTGRMLLVHKAVLVMLRVAKAREEVVPIITYNFLRSS